jgi:hypothetical protein
MELDTCYDCKKTQNDKFTCNICFMDVPTRYKKRHFKNIWHEKLEKYINDLGPYSPTPVKVNCRLKYTKTLL